MSELTTTSRIELCAVNIVLGVGMGAGVLVALMGADLTVKTFGVTMAATATVMSAGITRYWPFSMEGPT